jgi:hypothetical protein
MRRMDSTARPAALLLLTALLGTMVPACSGRRGAAGLVRSSSLRTYPQDTAALLVLEVKKIRSGGPDPSWITNLASMAGRDQGPIADTLRRLAPHILKDLDRLSLAVVPRGEHGVGYGVLAEGNYGEGKLRQALGGQGLLTLVETGSIDLSAVVLKDGSLALGPKSVLETMLANDAGRGHGLDESPAILDPLESVRPEAQVWGAIDCRSLQKLFQTQAGDLPGLALKSAPMQSLVSIGFRGMVAEAVDIDLYGRADGAANAKSLADAARGIVALGRVGVGRDQAGDWLALLDSIRIDQSGPAITLRASVPARTMESFVGRMKSIQAPEAGTPPAAPEAGASPSPEPPGPTVLQGPKTVPPAPQSPSAPSKAAAPPRKPPSSAPSPPRAGSASRPTPGPRSTRTPSDEAP